MDWTDLALFGQRIFLCMITTSVAGSVFMMFLWLLEHHKKWKNSRMYLSWMKIALLMYLLPFAQLAVIGTRIEVSFSGIMWTTEYMMVSTAPMSRSYAIIMGIFFAGFFPVLLFRIKQYWNLRTILKGNIPIENEILQKVLDECGDAKIMVCQNDLLKFPITTGIIKPKIILPVNEYEEKEYRMILAHERNHIRANDLLWKKIALIVTFIHWWNPMVYVLLSKLILQEEIECDIRTCEESKDFTMKEYGYFLSGMESSKDELLFASAICKTNRDLFRRLEGMISRKKVKKSTAIFMSSCLLIFSVIPSYAASEAMAQIHEKWMRKTETAVEEETVDYASLEEYGNVSDDKNIAEEGMLEPDDTETFGSEISLDKTIKGNTRQLYAWKNLKKGDVVVVIAKCNDQDMTYRIGLKKDTGELTYRDGKGELSHIFTVSTDGKYAVYVENRNSKSISVTGRAVF